MTIIDVRPSKNFGGSWVAIEAPGVQPAFSGPNGKERAIRYASNRFGGRGGEVHVYEDDGLTIERTITIDGRGQYPHERRD